MFVLLTLLCVYLGWALNWKRQRDAFLKQPNVFVQEFPDDPQSPPLALWLIGERGYSVIIYYDPDMVRYENAKNLFPEAFVM